MPSSFSDRIEELLRRVPAKVEGTVEVDQVYAHYQHERADLHHPRGGQWKYLEEPLISGAEGHMRRLAKTLLDPEGPRLGMQEVVEDLAGEVHDRAPREFNDLRNSAHPTVRAEGRVVYDRPPLIPRLSEAELREKNRLRHAGHGGYPLDHPQHIANRIAP